MANSLDHAELRVEGDDDKHVIIHLLQRFGMDMSEGVRPFDIKKSDSISKLIEVVPEAIVAATTRHVGFVLDIDAFVKDRWAGVRRCLEETGLKPPRECPAEGYVAKHPEGPFNVGVWLMPDCTTDGGKLEGLLQSLIPLDDALLPLARESTAEAIKRGATFPKCDRIKAEIHCWLAWQKDPGRPFGTAIKAKFFGQDSPLALAFLRWLGRLYELPHLANIGAS